MGRILVGLCLSIIIRCTHHEGACTDAHHLEADAIDSKGHRWVGQYLEVEGYNTIAAGNIGECIGIGARLGVGVSMPSIILARANGVANDGGL